MEIKYLFIHQFKIYHLKAILNIYMKELSFKMAFLRAELRFKNFTCLVT
jgi:hypothetical protein